MIDRCKPRVSTRAAVFCDECANHRPTALTPAQACHLGHRPRFFTPHTMRDIMRQDYGWKRRCADFSPATAGKRDALKDARVVFIDGVGAGRLSVESCRDGVQWIRVGDRVYWPLSDADARRLQSACCGNGSFDGPASSAGEGEGQ